MSGVRKKITHDPVRGAVVEILGLVESGKFTADEAIAMAIKNQEFTSLDIRFIRQLVNGTIKMKRRLDHDIRFFLSKPSEKMSQRLIDILRLGFYQLFFTERIPAAAAVSESVNLTHHFCDAPRARLVNAVLRNALRYPERVVFRKKEDDPVAYLGSFYSYPDWFVGYCLDEFGFEETTVLLENMNRPPSISFRANVFKAKPEQVAEMLDKESIKYTRGNYLPEFFHLEEGPLPLEEQLIKTGKIYIQDESAAMAIRLLNPKTGLNVLDLAAAPGGKTSYAAVRMHNKGMITAVDKSRARLELLIDNCKRLGVKNVNPVLADNLEFKGGPFHRVIIDVPCSGWGNAGKHSDLRWSKDEDTIKKLCNVQRMMIDKAAKLVRPGGVLVYSTCTIVRRENDEIVEEFLLRNNDFELESAGEYYNSEVVSERGFLKTYPNIPNLSGSFAARLKKKPTPKKS
nr:16S rRNA (cytosine(967)-C(5))-methyltransferase RsmB [candidate division Zixibacteria bacterium]